MLDTLYSVGRCVTVCAEYGVVLGSVGLTVRRVFECGTLFAKFGAVLWAG